MAPYGRRTEASIQTAPPTKASGGPAKPCPSRLMAPPEPVDLVAAENDVADDGDRQEAMGLDGGLPQRHR